MFVSLQWGVKKYADVLLCCAVVSYYLTPGDTLGTRLVRVGATLVCVQIDNIAHKTKRRAAKFMNRPESCLPHKSCLLQTRVGLLIHFYFIARLEQHHSLL